MYIQVGLSTISQLEPILAEIKALEKIERHCNFSEYSKEFADTKEDRLPIFAKFSIAENSLDRVHFAMIRRLYGVYGKQIVEVSHLLLCTCVQAHASSGRNIFQPNMYSFVLFTLFSFLRV